MGRCDHTSEPTRCSPRLGQARSRAWERRWVKAAAWGWAFRSPARLLRLKGGTGRQWPARPDGGLLPQQLPCLLGEGQRSAELLELERALQARHIFDFEQFPIRYLGAVFLDLLLGEGRLAAAGGGA